MSPDRGPLIAAGLLIGAGLGAFVDGIVFHELLQWHHLLSGRRDASDLVGLQVNMIWDGVFHACAWAMTAWGVGRLWVAARDHGAAPGAGGTVLGACLLGAGLFDVLEGVIDHHLLQIHHVHPGKGELAWDLGYLGAGCAIALVGYLRIRAS
jgi:uncharacterized membrane protein